MNPDKITKEFEERHTFIERCVAQTNAVQQFIERNESALNRLPDFYIDFWDVELNWWNLTHPQIMEVILAFPGQWSKEPDYTGEYVQYKLTANRDANEVSLCIRGEPPPNCKVVWEDVEIPARTTRQAKLVCNDQNQSRQDQTTL
jgi:hypothetical protein